MPPGSPEIGARGFFPSPEQANTRKNLEQMDREIFAKISAMPPGPEQQDKLHRFVRQYYLRESAQARRIIEGHKDHWEKAPAILQALTAAALPAEYVNERRETLDAIRDMTRSVADPQSGFNYLYFDTKIYRELYEVDTMMRTATPTANPPAHRALQEERRYLETILGWFGSPSSPALLAAYDVPRGVRRPDAAARAKDIQTSSLVRATWAALCATMGAITLAIAIKLNPRSPNLLAPAIWAALLALPFIDWTALFGPQGEQIRENLSCLSNGTFTNFVGKYHGTEFAECVDTLLRQNPEEIQDLVGKLRSKDENERKEAQKTLLTRMLPREATEKQRKEAEAALQDPGFSSFILPPLKSIQGDFERKHVRALIESGRAQPSRFTAPPPTT